MESNCRGPWRRSLRALFLPWRWLLSVDLQAEKSRRSGHWRALSTNEIKRYGLLLVGWKFPAMYRAKLPQKCHRYSSLHRLLSFLSSSAILFKFFNSTLVTTNDFKHNCINLNRLRLATGTFFVLYSTKKAIILNHSHFWNQSFYNNQFKNLDRELTGWAVFEPQFATFLTSCEKFYRVNASSPCPLVHSILLKAVRAKIEFVSRTAWTHKPLPTPCFKPNTLLSSSVRQTPLFIKLFSECLKSEPEIRDVLQL